MSANSVYREMSEEQANAEILTLREIMCDNRTDFWRMERVIYAAAHLLLKVPESKASLVRATIYEAERRSLYLITHGPAILASGGKP